MTDPEPLYTGKSGKVWHRAHPDEPDRSLCRRVEINRDRASDTDETTLDRQCKACRRNAGRPPDHAARYLLTPFGSHYATCSCGWTGTRHVLERDAVREWLAHRVDATNLADLERERRREARAEEARRQERREALAAQRAQARRKR